MSLCVYIRDHRRRDEDLVKTLCPRMRVGPKCGIFHGLSNETSLEKIGRGLFVFRFYTVNMYNTGQKAEKL
jgi:hypothetical protein